MPTARFIKRVMAAACRTAIAKGVSALKRRFVGNTFLRYCISYIIVLILPIVFIATSFNTRFIAGYRQSLTNQIKLTAQKTMGDLERQLSQMTLIAMQFSFDGEFSARQLKSDKLVYRHIRETLAHYRFIGGYAYDITYINCDSTDAYYTTMGTYNPHYFKHYDVNGRVCTADEYLSGLSGRMWVPLDAAYKRDVTSGQSVDYVTPVFNVENGWLIFTIGQSQLCSMLDLSVAHLNTCAILNADGEIVYQNTDADVDWAAVQRESVEDWCEIDGSYVLTTSSGELGLSCVYAISKDAMLAEVNSLTRHFMLLLMATLVVGCSLAVMFSRMLTRPIDALVDTVRRIVGGRGYEAPSSISDVKSAIESVHNEHQQMQSRYIEMERHNVLMRLMSGQYVSREEMEEDCAGVDVPVQGYTYAVVLIDELRMPTSETEREIGRLYGSGMRVYGFRFREQQCQVFLLAECEGRNDWRSQMFELLKGRYPGIMLTIGSQTDDLLNVRDSYQDAVFSRRMAQMKKLNAPIMSDNAHVREGQMVYPKQEIDALYNILRQKDVEKLSFIQDTLMFSLRTLSEHPVYQQALCYDIISTYNLALAKLEIGGRTDGQPFKQYDRGSLHIDKLLEIIQSLYDEAMTAFFDEKAPSNDDTITDVVAYIDAQRENIPNACEVAEHFGVSPSNLSHQFKRATGETLSNYIAGHKLRVARDLLTNTDMDINGIGEILGYTHPSSFIRMFHRVEGITPAQYREEHSAAENE